MNTPVPVYHLVLELDIEGGGGGLTRFAIELCEHLDRTRFDSKMVSLFSFGKESEEQRIDQLERQGIGVLVGTRWDPKRPYASYWKAQRRLWHAIRLPVPGILHSHSEFTDSVALLLKLTNPTAHLLRTIQYGHWQEWRKKPLRRLLLTNFLCPLGFEAEVGVNPAIAQRLSQRFLARLLRKQGMFIPNAVNLDRLAGWKSLPVEDFAALRDSLNIPPGAIVIGNLGRLVEQKGHSYLLEAAAIVSMQYPQAVFLVAGEGELRAALESQAFALGISSQMRLIGSYLHAEKLYSLMDLFVSSSLWEGMPVVILESMACGVPVVGTRIPGTADLIEDGFNGWLVNPGDPGSLAQAILAALDSPEEREKRSRCSLEKIRQYAIERISGEYEALYLSLAGTKG